MAYSGIHLQNLLNKLPRSVFANSDLSGVVTDDGNVYVSGLIGNEIRECFRQLNLNQAVLDNVIYADASQDAVYFLNNEGQVFAYNFTIRSCSPVITEVFSPASCRGDYAVKIRAGAHHVLILTRNGKVYGAGSNSQYQIVPQGAGSYGTATQILVTDYIYHNNNCCDNLNGTLNLVDTPRRPASACSTPKCLNGRVETTCINPCGNGPCVSNVFSTLAITVRAIPIGLTTPLPSGIILPLKVSLMYSGTYCVDDEGIASGTVAYTITSIALDAGRYINSGTLINPPNDQTYDVTVSNRIELLAVPNIVIPGVPFSLPAGSLLPTPIIPSLAGLLGTISFTIPTTPLSSLDLVVTVGTVVHTTTITALSVISSYDLTELTADSSVSVPIVSCIRIPECAPCETKCADVCFPQPCWVDIAAGDNTSVLISDSNQLWTLGDLYLMRNNLDLVNNNELEDLLSKFDTKISFPSDQLKCRNNIVNDNCQCQGKCVCKPGRDLTKFNISVNIPKPQFGECDDGCTDYDTTTVTACDFIRQIRKADEEPNCTNTCYPCDPNINIHIECCRGAFVPHSFTIYNRKSVCASLNPSPRTTRITVDPAQINVIDYNQQKYSVNGVEVCNDNVLVIIVGRPCHRDGEPDVILPECSNVDIFVDLDKVPRSITLTPIRPRRFNVDFPVYCGNRREIASPSRLKTVLNFGGVMDPVDLTNLKSLFSSHYAFYCKNFTNPAPFRFVDVYAIGGDNIRLVDPSASGAFSATPDLPLVFDMKRKILDVAVGYGSLSVLTGGVQCGNEIHAIGQNCWGQLGLKSHVTSTCFKKVNKCYFDCQVVRIFSGPTSVFYVDQEYRVYASGKYKGLVNSDIPVKINSVSRAWKTKKIAISNNQIVILGGNGEVYGVGNNQLGQLGCGHRTNVCDFVNLDWFRSETFFESSCGRDLCETEKRCPDEERRSREREYVREDKRDDRRGGCEKDCRRVEPREYAVYSRGREGGCGRCRKAICGCEKRPSAPARLTRDRPCEDKCDRREVREVREVSRRCPDDCQKKCCEPRRCPKPRAKVLFRYVRGSGVPCGGCRRTNCCCEVPSAPGRLICDQEYSYELPSRLLPDGPRNPARPRGLDLNKQYGAGFYQSGFYNNNVFVDDEN